MKGFHVLRIACARLWAVRRDFEVVVTDAAPEDRPVEPWARYAGWQSQADLPGQMTGADLVVVPTVAQEALGRTAVEAMAAGKPVVASRIGGLPFTVTDGATGLLCAPNDPADLGAKIAALLDDPTLRARLGAPPAGSGSRSTTPGPRSSSGTTAPCSATRGPAGPQCPQAPRTRESHRTLSSSRWSWPSRLLRPRRLRCSNRLPVLSRSGACWRSATGPPTNWSGRSRRTGGRPSRPPTGCCSTTAARRTTRRPTAPSASGTGGGSSGSSRPSLAGTWPTRTTGRSRPSIRRSGSSSRATPTSCSARRRSRSRPGAGPGRSASSST
ncbi:D-inositol 3-phosphate glycosyltransferase [Frigoriglobus tundricola]|uniref:D-inositol 3-phosphate glycosyltransferase n=2 Tax=Frigoriglobus tundricola TaxID=2774151 RepID=A0A6M5Z5F1_9BACT|nr:D-inositol 3-phosphate glycosyltransferase [Frigoriglobus tundricola]